MVPDVPGARDAAAPRCQDVPVAALGPRVVIAGTHSGVGKTTVATGLMAALSERGLRVGAAKVGPDFIDPGYHRLATGRPSRNLDEFLSGAELLPGLAARAGAGCDVLVVEGVMGLFDGSGQAGCDGSTAAVARLLGAPVILVVDASAMSGSVAALVHGFATLDPAVRLAGVILNRVGSVGHAALLREALSPLGVPVLGVITNDDSLVWRERHLGLVPVAEHPDAVRRSLRRLAATMAANVGLEALMDIARAPTARVVADPSPAARAGRCRVAVCSGPAFSFVYPENLELLQQAGAELVLFDPLEAAELPVGCTGLYAGGGFPEVFAGALGENRALLADVRRRVAAGVATWAECGGLIWLAESLDGSAMAGALAGVHVTMSERLTIGYRDAITRQPSFFGPSGTALRGHEFHRSVAEPPGDGIDLAGRFGTGRGGFVSETIFASYLHQHLSSAPALAERFVAAASTGRGGP